MTTDVLADVLTDVLDRAREQPDRPAVSDPDRALTYGQLVEEAGRWAAGLEGLGVTEGDRVALHLPNSVDFVVAALATLWLGACFVPLAVTDPEARVEAIVADCSPTVVVGHLDPDAGADADGNVDSDAGGDGDGGADSDSDATAGSGRPHGSGGAAPRVSCAELAARPTAAAPPGAAPAGRPAYAIYTSGTTGTPKGVLIGHGAFTAAVHSAARALGLDRSTRALCVSPFHFDGSFGTVFPTLVVGGALVIRPRQSLLFPRTFIRAVEREGITFTGFSPSYLKLLLASPNFGELAGGTLSVIALGGEATALADLRALWAAAPQIRVFNRYGPTETTIAVTHIELTPELVAGGTVPIGSPHPGVSFHLVDETGSLLDEPGRVGELYIGGVQLMAGYWGAPELTADVLRTDVVPGATVYRTGDLVYRDVSGEFVYVDRADRVVKRSGVRISLLEQADALRGSPGVSDVACVVFDNDGQVGMVAFVVAEGPLSVLELRQGALKRLPGTMLPDRIELVDELPLTSSSKLDERRLLAAVGLHPPGTLVAQGVSRSA